MARAAMNDCRGTALAGGTRSGIDDDSLPLCAKRMTRKCSNRAHRKPATRRSQWREEARAYEQLSTQFKLTQEQSLKKWVAAARRWRTRCACSGCQGEVQSWIADNRLSVGHASDSGLANPAEQRLVAERVLKRNLTVRETEHSWNSSRVKRRSARAHWVGWRIDACPGG